MGLPMMMHLAQQIEDDIMALQLHRSGTNFSKQHLTSSGANFSKNVTQQLYVVSNLLHIHFIQFSRLSKVEMLEKNKKVFA